MFHSEGNLARIDVAETARREASVSPGSLVARNIAIAAAYLAGGHLGLEFAQVDGQVTLVWPPLGLALAAALLWGNRIGPGIWVGAVAVNLIHGLSGATALLIATGNTLGPLVAATLLTRATRFRADLRRRTDIGLLLAGALGASVITASVGAATLLQVVDSRFLDLARVWLAGDCAGGVIVTPVVLTWANAGHRRFVNSRRQVAMFVTVCLGVAVSVPIVFTQGATFLALLPYIFVMAAALRFAMIGSATTTLVLSAAAVICTAAGVGPYADSASEGGLFALWTYSLTATIGALIVAGMVVERQRAAEHERMLLHELDHRVKNNLATVIALAEQSGKSAGSVELYVANFVARLRALAGTHEALARRRWESGTLRDVVRTVASPYTQTLSDTLNVQGSELQLTPKASASLTMALHELATNAAKHGAWSVPGGRVELQWTLEPGRMLKICWAEFGAPSAAAEISPGFGVTLMQGIVQYELRGELAVSHRERGILCEISLPLDRIEARA